MGLGMEFLRCVEAALLAIQRAPLSYPVTVKENEQMFVRLGLLSPGVVWIDAVQFEKGKTATEYESD